MSEMEATEILEDDFEYAEMPGEVVYDLTEGNIRNYAEISVDAGSDCASLYFEGTDDDGKVYCGRQLLDADELQALIDAAERALATVQANS